MTLESENAPITGHVVGTGTWHDWFRYLPNPVLAFGSREIYRVILHGTGFSLPVSGSEPARGFFTTFFVAAISVREAELKARACVTREWTRRGADRIAQGQPVVEVEELVLLPQRFVWRSGGGFLLYRSLKG